MEAAIACKEEGNALYSTDQFEKSLLCYRRAADILLSNTPADGERAKLLVILHSNSSQALICMARWDEAMEEADKALDIDPAHAKSIDRHKFAFESRQAVFNTKVGDHTLTPVLNEVDGKLKMRAMSEGVSLNNQGVQLAAEGQYEKALKCFREALAIKLAAYGEVSFHYCITLSGVADALLSLGRIDEAENEAQRMLRIATTVGDAGQLRIAKEILTDISRAKKRRR